jgi:hypothetical protein
MKIKEGTGKGIRREIKIVWLFNHSFSIAQFIGKGKVKVVPVLFFN